MSVILKCNSKQQAALTVLKEQYKNGSKYYAQLGLQSLATVDSFTKLIRILRLEGVDLSLYSAIEGEEQYIKAFRAAQEGELSFYNAKERIVDICQRLVKGERISTEHDAILYGVHPETIKLDIYTLRNILTDYTIDFDGVYRLEQTNTLTVAEAFVLLLMVYHSKSLNIAEAKQLQDKLFQQFSGSEQQQLSRFFQSYIYYYKPYMKEAQLTSIETIFRAISEQHELTFYYSRKNEQPRFKCVKPLTIILHDRMYYLVAEERSEAFSGNEKAKEKAKNFRFDRISALAVSENRFKQEQKQRFQQGQYIDEAFNMYTGNKEYIRFRAKHDIVEYVDRQFPQATVISSDEQSVTYEVMVLGTEGILLWLLSQKDNIEVLAPQHMRQQIKETIASMLRLYD